MRDFTICDRDGKDRIKEIGIIILTYYFTHKGVFKEGKQMNVEPTIWDALIGSFLGLLIGGGGLIIIFKIALRRRHNYYSRQLHQLFDDGRINDERRLAEALGKAPAK